MSDLISRQAAIDEIIDSFECGDYLQTTLRRLENLPSAQPERWIPCSERLPKYGRNVLITNDKGNVSYGRFRGVEFWKEDGDSFWTWKKKTIEHVLAWMPLPSPYKGEQE